MVSGGPGYTRSLRVEGNSVQALYRVCRESFRRGTLPRPDTLTQIETSLNNVTCEDLGLEVPADSAPGLQQKQQQGAGKRHQHRTAFNIFGLANKLTGCAGLTSSPKANMSINYQEVCECDQFTIAVFCLPSAGTIPLHNHPDMVVMSKLLYGSLHIRSYDWVDGGMPDSPTSSSYHANNRPARLVRDEVVTGPSEVITLFPNTGGNIHAFTALTPCAVLDVLAPPYDPDNDRDCTYYSESNPPSKDSNFDAYLSELEPPDDFVVKEVPYKGFKIEMDPPCQNC